MTKVKVMANSVPKSGTNLLLQLLILLGFKEGNLFVGAPIVAGRYRLAKQALRGWGLERVTVGIGTPVKVNRRWLGRRISRLPDGSTFVAHCPYTAEITDLLYSEKVSTICIFRDPRDVAVSLMHYLKQNPQHYLHDDYMNLPDDHARLLASINGGNFSGHTLVSLEQMYRPILEWEENNEAMLVRFEDLVGPQGGGSTTAQRRTIEQVAAYLNLEVQEHKIDSVQKDLFGATRTFRKGQIGGWESEFSDEHRKAVKDVAGNLLLKLGYEKELDW